MATEKSLFATIWPIFIFLLMTFQRAGHNSLIEYAKDGMTDFPFPPSTIIFFSNIGCFLCGIAAVWAAHGGEAAVKCFDYKGWMFFGYVGFWYNMGDVFEMEANRFMDSATYTVLSQSKLIITAVMMIFLMNKNQTQLQWAILLVTTLGMGEYVIVDGKGVKNDYTGIILALIKVFISCFVAVLTERAMKIQKDPFLVQFVWSKVSQGAWSFIYMMIHDHESLRNNGILYGYTSKTWLLLGLGFIFKALLTQYVLKILDSLLKNITEVIAVMLVFFNRIMFMGAVFKLDSFVAAVTVMMSVYSYVLTKQEIAAREKAEATKRELPDIRDLNEPLLSKDDSNKV